MRLIAEPTDWCPRCGAHEAFHPEACGITPAEWRRESRLRDRRVRAHARIVCRILHRAARGKP